jgi:hypothetical protein
MSTNKDHAAIGWLHDSGFAFYDVPSIWWKSVRFSTADCGLPLSLGRIYSYELELLIAKTGTIRYPDYMCYANFREMPYSQYKSGDKPQFKTFMGCTPNGGGKTPKEAFDACMSSIKAQMPADQVDVLDKMLPKLLVKNCEWDYLPRYDNSKATAKRTLIKNSRKYIAEFVEKCKVLGAQWKKDLK